jgi:hypothetical protein
VSFTRFYVQGIASEASPVPLFDVMKRIILVFHYDASPTPQRCVKALDAAKDRIRVTTVARCSDLRMGESSQDGLLDLWEQR